MSFTKYILQSCDGSLRFRVNFSGATSLSIGETWYLECENVTNGCYEIQDDTDEDLQEYNVDDCMFIEYDDCEECDLDDTTALVLCNNYRGCSDDDRSFPLSQISYPAGYPDSGS